MNHPRQQLLEIQRIAARALGIWHDFETTCADLAVEHSDRLGVHGGNISDPVYASNVNNERWDENAAEITEALGLLRSIERRMAGIAAQHPETARHVDAAIRAARCSDPICTDNAVKDGLCFAHWQQQRTRTGS